MNESSIKKIFVSLSIKFLIMKKLWMILLTGLFLVPAFGVMAQENEGKQLYMQHCAQCHGAGLSGGNAQSLIDGVWHYGEGRNYKRRNIKFGIPHVGMPAYKEAMTDEEINMVLNYIEDFEAEKQKDMPEIPLDLLTLDYQMEMEVVTDKLEIPWAIDFVDENRILVTERPGRLRIIENGELLEEPVKNTPEVLHSGQGGLLDVKIDPDYEKNGWVYLAYSHELKKEESDGRTPAMTRIVRGKITNNAWTDQEVLFEAPHETYRTTRHHYGCRIVFDPEGHLHFSIGDRGAKEQAQDLSRPNGKIHRINPDGSIPEDNPFVDREGALPSVFAFGSRNAQGLAVHPETGEVWETEHGPMGGDEINVIEAGNNYGWPVITYGKNYNGTIITEETDRPGMEQPILYWKPSIAVCGMSFYTGKEFPKWNNDLLVTALRFEEVQLHRVYDHRILHYETILKNAGRVRDAAPGPDGAIYVVLNQPGRVVKLTNADK
jgi:glucose/arabinose dehydrogenase